MRTAILMSGVFIADAIFSLAGTQASEGNMKMWAGLFFAFVGMDIIDFFRNNSAQ